MAENKISEIIENSLEQIRTLIDANTIIGQPIAAGDGTTVIPVSKVSMGFASGGIDYTGKRAKENNPNNFGGGGGTGLTVSPVAFLVIKANGDVSLLNIAAPGSDASSITALVEKTPELVNKLKDIFVKKKEEKKAEKEAAAEAAE